MGWFKNPDDITTRVLCKNNLSQKLPRPETEVLLQGWAREDVAGLLSRVWLHGQVTALSGTSWWVFLCTQRKIGYCDPARTRRVFEHWALDADMQRSLVLMKRSLKAELFTHTHSSTLGCQHFLHKGFPRHWQGQQSSRNSSCIVKGLMTHLGTWFEYVQCAR